MPQKEFNEFLSEVITNLISHCRLEYKLIHPDAKPPYRKRITDAGYDISSIDNIIIPPKEIRNINTGIIVACPPGYYMTIEGRSSMFMNGLIPFRGIIDSTYCGQLCIALINITHNSYEIKKGDRIAQILIHFANNADLIEVSEFSPEYNQRGTDGFGSSGR